MVLPFVGDGATNFDSFSASVKPAENTPAGSTVYPQVYPFENLIRPSPLKTGASTPGSNGAGAPYTDEKAPGRKAWGFFVVAGNQIFDGLHR